LQHFQRHGLARRIGYHLERADIHGGRWAFEQHRAAVAEEQNEGGENGNLETEAKMAAIRCFEIP